MGRYGEIWGDSTLMFFRVTRTMRASCCGVKAWNSACPVKRNGEKKRKRSAEGEGVELRLPQ